MKRLTEHVPAGNLTELWWDDEQQDLLTVNGFSGRGSDFEIFRDYCICAERMPDAPSVENSRRILRGLFACELPPDTANCHAIWRLTAENLLMNDHFCTEAASFCRNAACGSGGDWLKPLRVSLCGEIFRLEQRTPQMFGGTWRSWSDRLEEELSEGGADRLIVLSLPEDFRAGMPNLYFAEQYLSGESDDRMLWLSQLAYFLFGFCTRHRRRAVIRSACDPAEVVALAEYLARLTPLPNLIWMQEDPFSMSDFLSLCRAVMRCRKSADEGEPPVLLANNLA